MNKILFLLLALLSTGLNAQPQPAQMSWTEVASASGGALAEYVYPDGAEIPRSLTSFKVGLQERPDGLWVRVMLTRVLERVRIRDKQVDSVRASSMQVNGIIAQVFIPKDAELTTPQLWAALWTREALGFADAGQRERAPVTAAIIGRIAKSHSDGKFISADALTTKIPASITDTSMEGTYLVDPDSPQKGDITGLEKLLRIQRGWAKAFGGLEKLNRLAPSPSNATLQELDRGQLAPEEGSSFQMPDFRRLGAVVARCFMPWKWGKKS